MKGVTADQEDTLLQQLTEITRVMQEGQLAEHIAPEKKSQDDWEGAQTPCKHRIHSGISSLESPAILVTYFISCIYRTNKH